MSEKMTVLAVDDTPENLHVLMELLKDDYAILAAKDGEKGLKLAQTKNPDIILLDVMMPGMDGYEVIEKLKSDECTRDIPVIFVTALSEADDESKGLAMGAIDYITKPFNPAIVKARLKNHLALREAARLRDDVERIMMHDLKSPLTAVIGLPQLLLMEEGLDEMHRRMLRNIEDAGYTLLSMVNMSTSIFKMERGTYEFSPESMDLAAVVRKVFFGIEDTASMRNINLVLEIDGIEAGPDQQFIIMGENLLCYSMLANLISNALDACPAGGRILVRLNRLDDSVKIDVCNQGEVPEKVRGCFFSKYATAGKSKGTGLGTYSARLIAQAHGGDITLACGNGEVEVSVTIPQ
ncbi:hybrid sensor histidine kinase/response regulator [Maridesulfovibrio sp.]|uniref:hybrid sensor histidine kinase/response regulator n=1 Tax=Maridesulfovibrio sp. TaxID=2795000 RepID=UPI002A187D5E|nr:hybrid sensor histidine kinase/response regulator [Maridesulfovibrio sp.]